MDNAVLLDTSVVSVFLKASAVHASRLQLLQQAVAGTIAFVSFVTVAELLFWAEKRGWSQKRKSDLDNRLRTFGVLDPTRTTAEIWAETKASCESKGIVLQPHDLWIASAALEFEIPVVTADGDFDRIPDLTVIKL